MTERAHTLEEAAAMLAMSPDRLALHCQQAAAVGRASFFWGAWKGPEGWRIPARVIRRALGPVTLQAYTVSEAAQLSGLSERAIRLRLCTVPAHLSIPSVRAEHQIGARLVTPTDLRIPAGELERLLTGRVVGPPPAVASLKKGQDPFPRRGEGRKMGGGRVSGAGRVVSSRPVSVRNSLSVNGGSGVGAGVVTVEGGTGGGDMGAAAGGTLSIDQG